MRFRLFALPFFLALVLPGLTYAQNVLVPAGSDTAQKPITSVSNPAPPPKMTPIPQPQPPTPTPSDISKLFNNPFSPETQASIDQIGAPYMQPAQQESLIQRTQQGIARLQQSLASLKQNSDVLNARIANAKTDQQKALYVPILANLQQTSAQIYNQLQRDQRRLDTLQSGPLKATDLMSLYQ